MSTHYQLSFLLCTCVWDLCFGDVVRYVKQFQMGLLDTISFCEVKCQEFKKNWFLLPYIVAKCLQSLYDISYVLMIVLWQGQDYLLTK